MLNENDLLPAEVLPLRHYTQLGTWQSEMLHSDEQHLLFWFTKGQGRFQLGAENHTYAGSSLIFVPAGLSHSFDVSPGTFANVLQIRSLDFLTMPRTAFHLRLFDRASQVELVAQFEAIERETKARHPGRTRAALYQAGLMGVFLERLIARFSPVQFDQPGTDIVSRFLGLLEIRFAMGLNLAQLSQEIGVTTTHLTRCCNAALGKTAHQLLQERIFFEARMLLFATNLPIQTIARDLGFRNPAYFTRAFQAHAGKTPTDFRIDAQCGPNLPNVANVM